MSRLVDSVSAGAVSIWHAFGMELVIFVVTLLCALFMREMKWDTLSKSAGKAKGLPSTLSAKSHSGETPPRKPKVVESVDGDQHMPTAERRQIPSKQVRTDQRVPGRSPPNQFRQQQSASTTWKVIDEIVEGMRENQHLKFAYKALQVYDELKVTLRESSSSIHDAVRYSRHSAVDFYSTIVHCAIRVGRHPLVEVILDDMVAHGVLRPLCFYESTMKQLAGQRQYHLALAVYDRLAADGLEPSAVTCSCLIGFAAEVGELQRAVAFFERLSTITTPSIRAFMTILRVHAKRHDWEASRAILRQMELRRVPVDALALNVVLATGVAADRLEDVNTLLAEAEAHKPLVSDVVSYNTLVKGYAQRGDVDGALTIMTRMRTRGFYPNAITFNTAMDSAIRSGRCADAWQLLDDLRATGLRPDKFTCSILIKGLSKNRDPRWVRRSLDVLHEVSGACDAALRSTMYHSVLDCAAQLSEGAPSMMAETLAQMRRHSVEPSPAAYKIVQRVLPNTADK